MCYYKLPILYLIMYIQFYILYLSYSRILIDNYFMISILEQLITMVNQRTFFLGRNIRRYLLKS